jgi:hypothetical protein
VKDFDTNLKEALRLVKSSLLTFDQVRTEAESWRLDSLKWQDEAGRLSLELTSERKDSEGLLRSLKLSQDQEESLKMASEDRAKLDAEAIIQARKQRDDAQDLLFVVGGAGLVIGGLVGFFAGHLF